MNRTFRALAAVALTGLLAGAAALIAGPLTPPAGAPTATYKTLAQIEPSIPIESLPGDTQSMHIIDHPGSYYLTGTITAAAGQFAIRVACDDVTIDLRGFTLDGAGVASKGIVAGNMTSPVRGLCVRDGAVVNFGDAGIDADLAQGCLFEGLRLRANSEVGLLTGSGSVVRNCSFTLGESGVVAEMGAQIVDCSATNVWYSGFFLGEGSSAVRCACYNPVDSAFWIHGNGCTLTDCVARGGNYGAQVFSSGNRIEQCKFGGAGTAIYSRYEQSGNTFIGNTLDAPAAGQGRGIVLDYGGNHVEGNHLYGFQLGIDVSGTGSTNVVIANTMHACWLPLRLAGGGSHPMIAPFVTTASGLAANPVANISQ